jgi:hypothetical protein
MFSQQTIALILAAPLVAEAGAVSTVSLTNDNFDELVKDSGKGFLDERQFR